MFNNFFFRKSCRLRDNVENILEPDRTQTTIRRKLHAGYQRLQHTLRLCNTYCFSTATMVVRTRLSVYVYTRTYIACLVNIYFIILWICNLISALLSPLQLRFITHIIHALHCPWPVILVFLSIASLFFVLAFAVLRPILARFVRRHYWRYLFFILTVTCRWQRPVLFPISNSEQK